MAPYKAKHEERAQRRAVMLEMRRRGLTYAVIARRFGVRKNTVRVILLRVYKQLGVKDVKGTANGGRDG